MSFSSWRGVAGIVRPTLRTGVLEELIRMLPEGVGVMPLCLNTQQGTIDEFRAGIDAYEPRVAELAEMGVDVINPSGAPPFMVLGYKGEEELIKKWEAKYKTPIFTSGTSTIAALNALKVKRFVGITYFPGEEDNRIYGKYYADAGFDVLEMAGMDVPFKKVQELASRVVYAFAKKAFLRNKGAQAIYLLGPGWRTLDIIQTLEDDLEVPVIHAIPTQSWDIQRHLRIRAPVKGFGRLIAEMPKI